MWSEKDLGRGVYVLVMALSLTILVSGCRREAPTKPASRFEEFAQLLDDPDPEVRAKAACELAMARPSSAEAVELLRPVLLDESRRVRQVVVLQFVIDAVAGRGTAHLDRAMPEFVVLLEGNDESSARSVALLLSKMGLAATPAMPALRACYEREPIESYLKWRCAMAMENVERGSMAAELSAAIRDINRTQYAISGPYSRQLGGPAGTQFMDDILEMMCELNASPPEALPEGFYLDFVTEDMMHALTDYAKHEPELVEMYRGYLGRGIDDEINQIITHATKADDR